MDSSSKGRNDVVNLTGHLAPQQKPSLGSFGGVKTKEFGIRMSRVRSNPVYFNVAILQRE
jgi:hypothetical protein